MDWRAGPADIRFLTAPETAREFDGVPVRELGPLEAAVASCFVGDLVGDCPDKGQHQSGSGSRKVRHVPSQYSTAWTS